MAYYIIDLWQEENIWSWACFADSEEEAQQQALINLNQNWNRDYADWDELAADMDGTAIRIEDPLQAMVKAEAMNMFVVLTDAAIMLETRARNWDGSTEGQARSTAKDIRVILDRIKQSSRAPS